MEQLQRICDTIQDKNEIAIIEQYANNGKRYTIIFISKIIDFLFIFCK